MINNFKKLFYLSLTYVLLATSCDKEEILPRDHSDYQAKSWSIDGQKLTQKMRNYELLFSGESEKMDSVGKIYVVDTIENKLSDSTLLTDEVVVAKDTHRLNIPSYDSLRKNNLYLNALEAQDSSVQPVDSSLLSKIDLYLN